MDVTDCTDGTLTSPCPMFVGYDFDVIVTFTPST